IVPTREPPTWKSRDKKAPLKAPVTITYRSKEKDWFINTLVSADKHTHSRLCIKTYSRITPEGKGRFAAASDIVTIAKMANNDFGRYAIEIKGSIVSNGKIEKAKVLIDRMADAEYLKTTYEWFLEQLKNAMLPLTDLKPLFITDKCFVLIEAINIVFPESVSLFIWHMMNNFRKELTKKEYFKNKKIRHKCLSLVEKMVHKNAKDQSEEHISIYYQLAYNPEIVSDFHEIQSEDDELVSDVKKAYNYMQEN
ncbi:hypothetical protein CU098_004604, partial [Rhizopus stolonifer]